MAYAQTSYAQRLGNGPYTIAEAGCFVTAFSNLLIRYGEGIDPPTLNQYLIDHGKYLHDPSEAAGLNDDVSWGTVSAYDSRITTTQIGGAGWPGSSDAIVKFIYKSARTGAIVTHFCLMADASAQTIVDSWDGVTKASPYGTPVAWATYERHEVQPVTPPAPAETPAFTIESIGEVTKELKLTTHLWDLNQRTWPGMVNNPVAAAEQGTTFTSSAIAHHVLGGAYYLPSGSSTQGYNLVDTEDIPAAPAAPAPVVTPAPADPLQGVVFTALEPSMQKMYVSKQGGAEKWSFKDVKVWGEFKSVRHYNYGDAVFISGSALHPLGARYEIDSNDWNGYETTGQPHNWYGFNKVDLSANRPSGVPAPAPAVTEAVAVTVIPTPAPAAPVEAVDWQSSYRPFAAPKKLIATRDLIVSDLTGVQKSEYLPKFDNSVTDPNRGVVKAFGLVFKDGIQYYRLRTNNDPDFTYWYCVPVVDAKSKKLNLLDYPTPPAPGTDTPQTLITSAEKWFYDILPAWFKKK